jgi:hypothetical protein
MGYPIPKVGAAMKLGRLATLAGRPTRHVGPLSPTFSQSTDLTPAINTPLLLPAESVKKVRFSFL